MPLKREAVSMTNPQPASMRSKKGALSMLNPQPVSMVPRSKLGQKWTVVVKTKLGPKWNAVPKTKVLNGTSLQNQSLVKNDH